MRSVFLTTLFSLILFTSLQAEEVIEAAKGGYGRYERKKNDPFSDVLSIKEAKSQYDLCIAAKVPFNLMDKCMWDGVTKEENDNGDSVPAMSAQNKQKVTEALKAYSQAPDGPVIEGQDPKRKEIELTSLASVGVENLTATEDAAYKKLQAYMEQKLKEALYGEVKTESESKGMQFVDQQTFYDLYESQVTKNLTMTISSFCIRVRDTTGLTNRGKPLHERLEIPDTKAEQEKVIKENLASIGKVDTATKTIEGVTQWNNCIKSIPAICNLTTEERANQAPKYTTTQACLVNRSMRATRQALLEISNIKEAFKENFGQNHARIDSAVDNTPVKIYDMKDKKTGVDALTTFTSGEVDQSGNSMRKENQDVLTRFQECANEQGEFLGDMEKCAEFLEEDVDKQKKSLAEVSLRTRAIGQKISEMEEDEIKKYLKEEGYQDDEVDAMIVQAGGDINKVREKINEHYNNQREALITSLSKQIEQRTIEEGDIASPTAQKKKLQAIYSELTTRVDDFKNLVHYNNIVSGFLEICSGTEEACKDPKREKRINSSIISREMANSAFSPQNLERNPADSSFKPDDHFSTLQSTLDEMGVSSSSSETGSVTLKVNELNSHFLNYFPKPK